jgi:hypothetical protein
MRDGNYLQLYRRDAVDITFALPVGIAKADVTESRFVITGYYLRYFIIASSAQSAADRQKIFGRAMLAPSSNADVFTMCPLPVKSRTSVFGQL